MAPAPQVPQVRTPRPPLAGRPFSCRLASFVAAFCHILVFCTSIVTKTRMWQKIRGKIAISFCFLQFLPKKNEDVAKIRLQNCHILENVTRAVKKTRIWQMRGQELPHPRFCARLPPSWVVRRSGPVCCGRAVPASLQPVQDCGDWLHRPSSFLQTDMIFILPETSLRGGRAIRKGESHG